MSFITLIILVSAIAGIIYLIRKQNEKYKKVKTISPLNYPTDSAYVPSNIRYWSMGIAAGVFLLMFFLPMGLITSENGSESLPWNKSMVFIFYLTEHFENAKGIILLAFLTPLYFILPLIFIMTAFRGSKKTNKVMAMVLLIPLLSGLSEFEITGVGRSVETLRFIGIGEILYLIMAVTQIILWKRTYPEALESTDAYQF